MFPEFAAYRKMVQHLVWATVYNVIANAGSISTGAAACLFIRWGLKLPMSAGALAMNLSTVIVHSNAQPLPRVKLGHRTKNVEGGAKHENNSRRLDPGHPPGQRSTFLRATDRNQLPARCIPSRDEWSAHACFGASPPAPFVGGDHVDVNIRAVRCAEIREAKHAAAVAKAIDGCSTLGRMQNAVETSGLEGLQVG